MSCYWPLISNPDHRHHLRLVKCLSSLLFALHTKKSYIYSKWYANFTHTNIPVERVLSTEAWLSLNFHLCGLNFIYPKKSTGACKQFIFKHGVDEALVIGNSLVRKRERAAKSVLSGKCVCGNWLSWAIWILSVVEVDFGYHSICVFNNIIDLFICWVVAEHICGIQIRFCWFDMVYFRWLPVYLFVNNISGWIGNIFDIHI